MRKILEKKLIKVEKDRNKFIEERQKIQENIDVCESQLKKINSYKNEYEKIDSKVKDFFEKLEGAKTDDGTGK